MTFLFNSTNICHQVDSKMHLTREHLDKFDEPGNIMNNNYILCVWISKKKNPNYDDEK